MVTRCWAAYDRRYTKLPEQLGFYLPAQVLAIHENEYALVFRDIVKQHMQDETRLTRSLLAIYENIRTGQPVLIVVADNIRNPPCFQLNLFNGGFRSNFGQAYFLSRP